MASLRMGPRHTMSGRRSSQAKERTQADGDAESLRSRCVSGLSLYQSTFGAIGVGLLRWVRRALRSPGLVELALRAGHRRRRVVAEQEVQVLAEHLAEVGGHDQRGDGAEREPFLRVHELLLVAAVEQGLLRLQPLGRLLLGVLLR